MAIDVVVPALGESITEATVLNWRKSPGDPVTQSEILVELETDKVTVEVEAPENGILLEISAGDGDDVAVGAVIARIGAAEASSVEATTTPGPADSAPSAPGSAPAAAADTEPFDEAPVSVPMQADASSKEAAVAAESVESRSPASAGVPSVGPSAGPPELPDPTQVRRSGRGDRITADDLREFLGAQEPPLAPAARRAAREHEIDLASVTPTGPGGRVLKEDVLAAAAKAPASPRAAPVPAPVDELAAQAAPDGPAGGKSAPRPATPDSPGDAGGRSAAHADATSETPGDALPPRTRRVPMSRLRRRLAERLKEAQNTAAMLTTYNEVDMSAVMELRRASGQSFEQRHGVRLGLMSFFVKASVSALRAVPEVNAEIDGTDIVYKDFYDIGVAVHSERGLVVPVVRDADRKGFADIERDIRGFAERANAGGLAADELEGGTFTVSNGGVYGSLMSAPILNPPQSGILGLHRIQERPIAHDGKVVVRPMMYLALSYDHRIVDGKGAVTFLVHLRDLLQQPAVLALDT
ncbi:MAG: 2-oxoglutarate dehydrogenase complex dihydrolipoyllysine-residue succinyltransferase [Rhodospirillales bacterium]|nr:2-oxoglutarate dehydrogenase complex dihydrolipoyllysine-residue succinyltransferase [Rhodospirillales bacterium]